MLRYIFAALILIAVSASSIANETITFDTLNINRIFVTKITTSAFNVQVDYTLVNSTTSVTLPKVIDVGNSLSTTTVNTLNNFFNNVSTRVANVEGF